MMKKQTGFSLIEILVAVVILAVTAIALAKLSGITLKGGTQATERQYAMRLGEGVMEQLRQRAYSKSAVTAGAVLNGATFNAGTAPVNLTTTVNGKTTQYTINVLFDGTPAWTTSNALIRTQVEVLWTTAANTNEKLVLVSQLRVPSLAAAELPAPTPGALATICGVNWNNSKCYVQGAYRRHGNDLYYCKAVGGCPKDAHNNPPARPDSWLYIDACPAGSQGGGGGNEIAGTMDCALVTDQSATPAPTSGSSTPAPTSGSATSAPQVSSNPGGNTYNCTGLPSVTSSGLKTGDIAKAKAKNNSFYAYECLQTGWCGQAAYDPIDSGNTGHWATAWKQLQICAQQ